jgi:2-amino-4-hydroxy-6-hydroxymethyldihydropteridine diphosphokinase
MNKIFLITGGNIGDRKKNLQTAANAIEENIGNIIKSSSIYETEAWGNTDQAAFYNQVHIVESELAAKEIMNKILAIEKKMGRIRTIKNAARIIDIDILFFNNEIINDPILTIPHKEISNRRFVLMPLSELDPDLVHPVLNLSINKLLSICKDPLNVTRLETNN